VACPAIARSRNDAFRLCGNTTSANGKSTEFQRSTVAQRLSVAKVKLEPKYDSVSKVFLTRDLANRVTRMTFGEAAAKSRTLSEDHQLLRAIELLEHSATQAQLLATVTTAKR